MLTKEEIIEKLDEALNLYAEDPLEHISDVEDIIEEILKDLKSSGEQPIH